MNVRRALETATYPLLTMACIGIAVMINKTLPPASANTARSPSVHGEEAAVRVMYRVVVRESTDRQVIQLYLTPEAAANSKEFLAFEYTYPGRLSTQSGH